MPQPTVRRLVGVYNADGTVLGELRYFARARLGRHDCALCDITHGFVRPKTEWRTRCAALPYAFHTYHRDDQPAALRASVDALPVVVAETDDGFVPLLDAAELAACGGSVDALLTAVESALQRAGLAAGP